MICPNCKCEYIRGVTECAECGVPLVDTLETPDTNPDENVRIFAIWRGNDPAQCERVKKALENAGIPFTEPDSKGHFSFIAAEPNLEIWISEADRENARKILLDLESRVDLDELTPEEVESLALPESDQPDSEDRVTQPPDSSGEWDEDAPVAEVWNGVKQDFADTLAACLREVGIGSRKLSEARRWRLVVRPEQESRAKEIVREVIEASPPE